MPEGPTGPERVGSAFPLLVIAATELNSASDQLTATISELDAALQKLNLGVAAWVPFAEGGDETGWYWSRSLGYARVGTTWGIALREVDGDYNNPDRESSDSWLFNNAPRWMRVDAIGKIPDLLEALIKQANATTAKLKKKNEQAKELTTVIRAMTAETKPAANK